MIQSNGCSDPVNSQRLLKRETIGTPLKIYYDHECFFCRNLLALAELRSRFTLVELVDGRSNQCKAELNDHERQHLNNDMLVRYAGVDHWGADALYFISRNLSYARPAELTFAIFRWRFGSSLMYPIMRWGRQMYLRVLGFNEIQ